MDKHELIYFLQKHITYFKNVKVEDFYLLDSLESSQLGLVDKNNYQISSLLKQISDYALIKEVLSDEQIIDIKNCLFNNNSDMLYDCLDVIDKCYQCVNILLEDNCHHPSINNNINLTVASGLYDVILDYINYLILKTDDNFQEDLIEFGNKIDDSLIEIPESILETIFLILERGLVKNSQELLLYLSNYAKNFLITRLGIKTISIQQNIKNQISYIDDCYINFIKDSNIHLGFDLKTSEVIIGLSSILEKANKYKDYSSDIEILDLIDELEEAYYLYESYKYRYLKDSYKEQKLLEKCKKM